MFEGAGASSEVCLRGVGSPGPKYGVAHVGKHGMICSRQWTGKCKRTFGLNVKDPAEGR